MRRYGLRLALAGVVSAIVLVTGWKIEGDKITDHRWSAEISAPNTGQLETVVRYVMRRVFERVIIFNMPINVEVARLGPKFLHGIKREIFTRNTDVVFGTGSPGYGNDIIKRPPSGGPRVEKVATTICWRFIVF